MGIYLHAQWRDRHLGKIGSYTNLSERGSQTHFIIKWGHLVLGLSKWEPLGKTLSVKVDEATVTFACDILLSTVPVRVPARNRWYTQGKQFEELVKGQLVTIRAGLRETKELRTAKHPRGEATAKKWFGNCQLVERSSWESRLPVPRSQREKLQKVKQWEAAIREVHTALPTPS